MSLTIENCPFCENYEKFYFDAKDLENGLNGGGGGGGKILKPFLANIDAALIF